MKLENRVAIVTGGGRGLGRAIAAAMADEGASLLIASRTSEELDATLKSLNLPDGRILKFNGDVSKKGDVKRMVDLALSKFGKIDILVNNAGTIGPIAPISKASASQWAKTIQTNLIGAFLCTKLVLPSMMGKNYGKIINVAGSGDAPFPNFSAYAASKSALIRFTATVAEEVKGHNIDVNSISPGGISTRMTEEIFNAGEAAGRKEHERAGQVLESKGVPLELPASLAVFLASKESDGITGKTLSAVHDNWRGLAAMKKQLMESDIYTVRRIDERERRLGESNK